MVLDTMGARIRAARTKAGLTQEELAEAVGSHPKTVSRWEGDRRPPEEATLIRLAAALGETAQWLRYGDAYESTEDAAVLRDSFTPNPKYRKRLPPAAYSTVYGYLEEMEAAGATIEQMDEAERVMVDGAYNKLNSRDVRDRSPEEMIGDINLAWAFIRDVLRKAGMKLK